ncbi:MAG: enoyl-CoA hydratase/isomerase family protein [Parasphingorhabdus sp.]|uniref:enoyl-CoA hydratase/isomerase family protein n=3 Tax=Parasphingorhabdus sp. TaxID=2709688 RepID=UPI003263D70E
MIDLVDNNRLQRLVSSRTALESFGPSTNQPYLILDLDSCDGLHKIWLTDLPCPVLGVGKGSLADACDTVLPNEDGLAPILTNIEKAPMASMILAQHLRASEGQTHEDALTAESFAYATVQKGPEFLAWRKNHPEQPKPKQTPENPLTIDIDDRHLQLTLNDPDNLNAIGVPMRDALCEALDLALADIQFSRITLQGAGRCFSTGGEVSEFGDISDPATAHWVRSLRLPAWRLARLRDRLHIHVDGAAVGAGTEIAAFAHKLTATEAAWFQLPELKYGLIPGAGGTASLPRRIGRQRTAYMALSMQRINAQTALEWGLIDEILS